MESAPRLLRLCPRVVPLGKGQKDSREVLEMTFRFGCLSEILGKSNMASYSWLVCRLVHRRRGPVRKKVRLCNMLVWNPIPWPLRGSFGKHSWIELYQMRSYRFVHELCLCRKVIPLRGSHYHKQGKWPPFSFAWLFMTYLKAFLHRFSPDLNNVGL